MADEPLGLAYNSIQLLSVGVDVGLGCTTTIMQTPLNPRKIGQHSLTYWQLTDLFLAATYLHMTCTTPKSCA